jgi:hypothetical protein
MKLSSNTSSNSLLRHTVLCVTIQVKKTSNYPLDGLESNIEHYLANIFRILTQNDRYLQWRSFLRTNLSTRRTMYVVNNPLTILPRIPIINSTTSVT